MRRCRRRAWTASRDSSRSRIAAAASRSSSFSTGNVSSSASHALLGAPIISPTSGAAGATISISGTNLGDTINNVFFPGTTAGGSDWIGDSFTRVGADEVTVKVPLSALSGRI